MPLPYCDIVVTKDAKEIVLNVVDSFLYLGQQELNGCALDPANRD
jgi:hypothetical protein